MKGGGTYKVKPGDNLWAIAEQVYGDGKFFKILANKLGTSIIKPGMVIKLPVFKDNFVPVITNADVNSAAFAGSGLGTSDQWGAGTLKSGGKVDQPVPETFNAFQGTGLTLEQLHEKYKYSAPNVEKIQEAATQASTLQRFDTGTNVMMDTAYEAMKTPPKLSGQQYNASQQKQQNVIQANASGLSSMQHGSPWSTATNKQALGTPVSEYGSNLFGSYQQQAENISSGFNKPPLVNVSGQGGVRTTPQTGQNNATGSQTFSPEYLSWMAENYAKQPGTSDSFDNYIAYYAPYYIANFKEIRAYMQETPGAENVSMYIGADGKVYQGAGTAGVQLMHIPEVVVNMPDFPVSKEKLAEYGYELNETGSYWRFKLNIPDTVAQDYANDMSTNGSYGGTSYRRTGGGGGGYTNVGGGSYAPKLNGLITWRGVGFG